jgi:Zn-dependent protease with chaperone function
VTPPNHQLCPRCGAQVPVHAGYTTWCDHCEWNLVPTTSDSPPTLLGSLYSSFGEKHSRGVFEELKEGTPDALATRLTATRLLAILTAGAVHMVTLAYAALGVVLIALFWPSPFAIILGVGCLLMAWVLRPRMAKAPRGILGADQCPALYRLVGEISNAYGRRSVPRIVVTGDFNATLAQVGWRNAKVLSLGLPLWVTLDPRERIAVLAHELAHGVNGDLTRSFFVGSAIDSLEIWHQVIRPDYIWRRAVGPDRTSDIGIPELTLLMIPFNLIRAAVARMVELFAFAAVHLVWFDSQRAEYLADHLAATQSGTEAMCSALGKLDFGPIFRTTVDLAVRRRDEEGRSLLERFTDTLRTVPDRELERIKRQQALETSRLDSTHPPTKYRIAFLQAHFIPVPRIVPSAADMNRVDEEMNALKERIELKIIDAHRARLHYGS